MKSYLLLLLLSSDIGDNNYKSRGMPSVIKSQIILGISFLLFKVSVLTMK